MLVLIELEKVWDTPTCTANIATVELSLLFLTSE